MKRFYNGPCLVVLGLLGYFLSSGPVLATAFVLREATHQNQFYWAMLPYLPLLLGDTTGISKTYIEWWVELFGTVGPG
jgi:hypothetical protein